METLFSSDTHVISRNKNGNIRTVKAGEKVSLSTSVGELVPRYTIDEQSRKKESPVKFYQTGELKSVPLEDVTEIETSFGTIKSELVTFHRSGALCRVFPLDGQTTGFWTEENEFELAETLDIPTPSGTLSVKPIYLQFYETGELESVLFWPKEKVTLDTTVGNVEIRKGICFHKNGTVKGFEPAKAISVESPIGTFKVFDPDPNGLQAENHAVMFTEDGTVGSVITSSNTVTVLKDGAEPRTFSPKLVSSYCNENAFFISPLLITIGENSLTCAYKNENPVTVEGSLQFEISEYVPERPATCVGCG